MKKVTSVIVFLAMVALLVGGFGCTGETIMETPTSKPAAQSVSSARIVELEKRMADLEGRVAEFSVTRRTASPRPRRFGKKRVVEGVKEVVEKAVEVAKEPPVEPVSPPSAVISWDEAKDYIGARITVCGPVVETFYDSDSWGRPTYLQIGNPYPDPDRFVVIIWRLNRNNFPQAPEDYYSGKSVCVTGAIIQYAGIPEIVVETPMQIKEQ